MQEHEQQQNPSSTSTGFINVDGGQLYYEMAGEGHPLVLLQGMSLVDQRIWDEQFHAFAQHYRVIRYDVRGCGKSPNSTGPYTQTGDLTQLLHILEIEKTYLIDLGASIAVDFAHEHASSVDALIIVSPSTSPAASMAEAMADLPRILERYTPIIEAIQRNDIQYAVDDLMKNELFLSTASVSDEAYQRVCTMATENIQGILSPPRSPDIDIEAFDTRNQWLKEIHIPTLFLLGEDAPANVQASAAALEKNMPGIQIRTIANAHFLLNIEQPNEFSRVVLAFLQGLPQ